jgi:pyroglutamyl-peptidase
MAPIFLLTGFEPFRGERINPSWEIARALDGEIIGGLQIKSVKVPVGCARASRRVTGAIVRYRPRAVLGLGEAGGRTALSVERVAVNLADDRAGKRRDFAVAAGPVIRGAPEAYFARLPIGPIMRELRRRGIPAGVSLSAGAYACNALMFTSLHLMRRRRRAPVGFIHLPYATRQAVAHPDAPSMTIALMEAAIRAVVAIIARAA